MAPKRQKSSPKVVSTVVRKATRRMMREETVKVATVGIQDQRDVPVETISVSTEKEPEVEETVDVATFKDEAPVTHSKDKEAEAGDKEKSAAAEEVDQEDHQQEEAEELVPGKFDEEELDKAERVPPTKTGYAPGAEKRSKGEKSGTIRRRRRRKRSGEESKEGSYKRYVFKVLKQVHPGMAVSSRAMAVLNGFVTDMFERLADEAARLSKYTGRRTLSSREVQGAVRLVLPGELGKHAIAEGAKAISNYTNALNSN